MTAASIPAENSGQARQHLESLPKVCLHDHLDGALRPGTVLELAASAGHVLPEQSPEALQRWFLESADSGSLMRYLETFGHTLAVLQSASALRRVSREYVLDCAAEGVLYAEVRWAPEQHVRQGLSMGQAVQAVAAGLAAGQREVCEAGGWIRVRQLLCAMRQERRSLEVAQLAVAHRGEGVVGFDLAGPEEGFPPAQHREALDFCAEHFLPVTLHAGEADGLDSIRSALTDGRALRLGHGVRILEDVTRRVAPWAENVTALPVRPRAGELDCSSQSGFQLGEVAAWVRDRRIGLEVCPCSNLQTGAAPRVGEADDVEARALRGQTGAARQHGEHPVDLLRRLGFAVLLSPDNRLMSATSMTREYELLAESFGYGEEEFQELALTAAWQAFLPAEERSELIDRIRGFFLPEPEGTADFPSPVSGRERMR